jgi:putative hydrolase of the HAD superfamily
MRSLPPIKAVIFDFIGTLTYVKNYDFEASKMKLHRAIVEAGFKVDSKDFLKAYSKAHEKYRVVRYQKLIEVTNAVWIAEALNNLGFKTNLDDSRIKTAVNVFFDDYLDSLRLRRCAKKMLKIFSRDYKLGLISNFTYAPVIYAGLRKMGINQFFNVVLVSQDVGWRKPHVKIFEEALKRLGVKAEETVYVGDSPTEDIKGAKRLGLKTVFVPSQFYPLESLYKSMQKPDMIAHNLCEIYKKFPKYFAKVNH